MPSKPLTALELIELETQAEVEAEAGWYKHTKPTNFRSFIRAVSPKFQFYKHCEILIDVCERIASGELKRVMVQLPPRHSKSELFSRLFTAYYLLQNPSHFVGLNSYAAELAYTLSRASRENYIRAGASVKDDAAAVKHWETSEGGGMWAAGVGGPITGKGFHCFPTGTMVTTKRGAMDIATLYRLQDRPKVLSYNHLRGAYEWRKITAAVKYQTQELYEIRTKQGRWVRATGDHRFWSADRGYTEARHLDRDGLITATIPKQQDLRSVRDRQERPRIGMQGVLCRDQARNKHNASSLLFMWSSLREVALSTEKGTGLKLQGCLLLGEMLARASRRQESAQMSDLWQRYGDQDKPILFDAMPTASDGGSVSQWAQVAGSRMPAVSTIFQARESSDNILLSSVRRQGALLPDGWQRQFSLQNRNELCQLVSVNASVDLRARRGQVRSLPMSEHYPHDIARPSTVNSYYSPSGRATHKQCAGESSNTLRDLPFGTPSLGRDAVSAVTRLRPASVTVYDIEVEGNHNFFANEILVHNCGIIDDPLKNAEEANSEVIREKQKEWYKSTFLSREEPDAAIVIIQTRWHEDDLTGWLLSEEENSEDDAERERWHIVCFPAVFEEEMSFPPTCTVEADFREIGAALCPERYDLKKLANKQAKGEREWLALYQQRPTAKQGLFFHIDRLEIVDAAPVEGFRCRGWDQAATEGDGDWTVGVKMLKANDGIYYIEDVIRGQWDTAQRDRMIRQTAVMDGISCKQVGEQEPGSGGKQQAQNFVRLLAGFPVSTENATNAKEVRADPFSSQVNAGNVKLVKGYWNKGYIEELRQFPLGKHDDQVDGSSLAFNKISKFLYRDKRTPEEKILAALPAGTVEGLLEARTPSEKLGRALEFEFQYELTQEALYPGRALEEFE